MQNGIISVCSLSKKRQRTKKIEQAGTVQVGTISEAQQIMGNFWGKIEKNWRKMKTLYPNFENVTSEL